jgi:hypothetical protein
MTLIAHDQFALRSGLFDESHMLWRRNALLQQMVDATEEALSELAKLNGVDATRFLKLTVLQSLGTRYR